MCHPKRVLLGVVGWSMLGLAAWAQNVPPTETDRLRMEVAELRQLVTQLTQRIQVLETQAVCRRSETQLRLTGFAEAAEERSEAAAPCLLPSHVEEGSCLNASKARPDREVYPRSGIEEGMQMDAYEHRQRWDRAIGSFRHRGDTP
jgi:hypothetical protein